MNEQYWGEKKIIPPKKTGGESTDKHISVQDNKIYYYSGLIVIVL